MIRKIDELGRIVIPKEYREQLNIHTGSCISMLLKNNKLVLEPIESVLKCSYCNHLCNKNDKYCSQCGKQL